MTAPLSDEELEAISGRDAALLRQAANYFKIMTQEEIDRRVLLAEVDRLRSVEADLTRCRADLAQRDVGLALAQKWLDLYEIGIETDSLLSSAHFHACKEAREAFRAWLKGST